MQMNLQNNDRLIIWKVPRTIAKITNHAYIPARFDIVVFDKTTLPGLDGSTEKQLIKRVIGLPGERVVVRGGKVTIYNKDRSEGFDPDSGETFRKIS